jgi:alpha-acetolactate decarboxylase
VGHQDDGFGAIVDGVLDGGDGAGDTLVVGDLGVGLLVEGNVEVDL